MIRIVLVIAFVASTAAAEPDPFGMLRDRTLMWRFEVVRGSSGSSVAKVGHAEASCWVDAVVVRAGVATSSIACMGTGEVSTSAMVAATQGHHMTLTFDADGVLEVAGDNRGDALADKTGARGFTFPRAIDHGKWSLDVKTADAHVELAVIEKTQRVLGKPTKVWFSTVKKTKPADGAYIAAFAPGIGPYLVCDRNPKQTTEFWCLRLVKVETKSEATE